MTPPEVGGLPAGEVGVAVLEDATAGDAVGCAELFVVALLVGAPPPTAPAGAPPPIAPAGAPPPTAFPPAPADVPVPPWPPPAPAAPAPPAPEPAPPPPPPWASAIPIGNNIRRAIAAAVELWGMGTPLKLVLQLQLLALVPVRNYEPFAREPFSLQNDQHVLGTLFIHPGDELQRRQRACQRQAALLCL